LVGYICSVIDVYIQELRTRGSFLYCAHRRERLTSEASASILRTILNAESTTEHTRGSDIRDSSVAVRVSSLVRHDIQYKCTLCSPVAAVSRVTAALLYSLHHSFPQQLRHPPESNYANLNAQTVRSSEMYDKARIHKRNAFIPWLCTK
jgi:hypothetical protein